MHLLRILLDTVATHLNVIDISISMQVYSDSLFGPDKNNTFESFFST